jgi:hypothetical protein
MDTLHENFETTRLLTALDRLDQVRAILADGNHGQPPEIRTELLRLHGLAMEAINQGQPGFVPELFELAGALEMQVADLVEALEDIQQTLNKLTDLYPESLVYGDDEAEVA